MKRTVRQLQIIEASRKIITQRGMSELTIRELAGSLKLTEGAIYKHFRSKKEIIQLLIADIKETLLNAVDRTTRKTQDPIGRLRDIFSAHVSYAEQRSGLTFVIINETLNLKDRNLQARMNEVIELYLAAIEKVIRDGIKDGKFRTDMDTRSASIAFFGMVQSLITVWALKNYDAALLRRHLPRLFEFYLKGVLSR